MPRNAHGFPTPYLCPIPPARDPEEANAALSALRWAQGIGAGLMVFGPIILAGLICWWAV